jgi:flagellar basal-body rod protein FlgB
MLRYGNNFKRVVVGKREFSMAAINTGLLDLLVKKMSYLNQAQTVHAQNVANANTPGYKALDVAPFTFDDALKQANVGMAVTDPRHIVPASLARVNKVAVHPKGKESGSVGDVEQESAKVSETGVQYELMTGIYHKIASLFKIALKGSA